MVELDKIPSWVCKTFKEFETTVRGKTGTYTVRFSRYGHKNENVQNDWSCTCPSYTYDRGLNRSGHCKHITKVAGSRCGWSEHHDSEDVVLAEGGTKASCPRCGGEVEPVEWGV